MASTGFYLNLIRFFSDFDEGQEHEILSSIIKVTESEMGNAAAVAHHLNRVAAEVEIVAHYRQQEDWYF